jgi:hypothetical protein
LTLDVAHNSVPTINSVAAIPKRMETLLDFDLAGILDPAKPRCEGDTRWTG